jgi:hypothetical protein
MTDKTLDLCLLAMGMVEITGSHTVAKLYVVIIEEIYHFTNI